MARRERLSHDAVTRDAFVMARREPRMLLGLKRAIAWRLHIPNVPPSATQHQTSASSAAHSSPIRGSGWPQRTLSAATYDFQDRSDRRASWRGVAQEGSAQLEVAVSVLADRWSTIRGEAVMDQVVMPAAGRVGYRCCFSTGACIIDVSCQGRRGAVVRYFDLEAPRSRRRDRRSRLGVPCGGPEHDWCRPVRSPRRSISWRPTNGRLALCGN